MIEPRIAIEMPMTHSLKKSSKLQSQQGFTLVEILAVLIILEPMRTHA